MTWMRCALTFGLIILAAAAARAQYTPPPPIILLPPPGYGFNPYYPPYAVVRTRIIVQPIVVVKRVVPPPVDPYDTAGIDLDVESPTKIWGEKPVAVKKPEAPKPAEVAKAPPVKKKLAPMPPPKQENLQLPLWQRLIDDGIAAFHAGEYGIALLRFRQAEAEPAATRALFLQVHALIAMNKYRDAVRTIEEGLAKHPQWPTSDFRPKLELYDNVELLWKEHRQQVEAVQREKPDDVDYLFLVGYLRWFAGERDIAVVYFRQARNLAADPQWADLFLKAGKN